MDLGVLEGQTRGDYFLNSIFDPSVKQCSAQANLKAKVVSRKTSFNENSFLMVVPGTSITIWHEKL